MQLKLPPMPERKDLKLAQANGLLGGEIWPAATALCHYLSANHPTSNWNVKDCIELGAGTGVVGIYAAAAFGYPMTLTEYRPPCGGSSGCDSDDEEVAVVAKSERLLNLLQQNVDLNRSLFSAALTRVCELDFSDIGTVKKVAASSKTGQGYDLILASDVTYTPSLHQPLANTISRLLLDTTSRCLVSHEERLLNVRGEDYQLMQFEQALGNANLEIVQRFNHTLSDGPKTHKVCVLEIQRRRCSN